MMTGRSDADQPSRRVLLSTLWIVIVTNMLMADVLTLFIPGALAELAATAGQIPITRLMLVAAIAMEVCIAMIVLCRVLNYRASRWANIIAGIFTIAFVTGGAASYPHYYFIGTIEVVCSLAVVWMAWKLPQRQGAGSAHVLQSTMQTVKPRDSRAS